jgi:hypothetical protein
MEEKDVSSEQVEQRSLTTYIIAGVAPIVAGPGAVALEHWLQNRPPKESPPEVVLPPGVEKDG